MIGSVIFDYNGVLAEDHKESAPFLNTAKKLGVSNSILANAVYNKALWAKAKRGGINEKDYWDEVSKRLDLPVTRSTWLKEELFMGITVRSELVEFIRELRKSNYKVALVSNATTSFSVLWRKLGLYDLFDLVLNSSEVKLIKPDPEILLLACKKMNVDPSECILIDDGNDNIQTANALGMHGILFTNSAQIIPQIRSVLGEKNSISSALEVEAQVNDEEKAEIKKIITIQKAYLFDLEKKLATFGPLYAPPYLSIELEKIKEEIQHSEKRLSLASGGFISSVHRITHNLPARREFVGRSEELVMIKNIHLSTRNVMEIVGMSGVGKTALALELAYQLVHENSYTHVVWLSARDREINLDEILNEIARTLGNDEITQAPEEKKRRDIIELLRRTKSLLFFDSLERFDLESVVPFIEQISEPTKVIVLTQRHILSDARILHLKGLNYNDAISLIKGEIARLDIKGSKDQINDIQFEELIKISGGNPLTIKWAIGQLRYEGPLQIIINEIGSPEGEIAEKIFNTSWHFLNENSKQLLFGFLAFANEVDLNALAATAKLNKQFALQAIQQLSNLYLIEDILEFEDTSPRYYIHPLTRTFIQRRITVDLQKSLQQIACRYYIDKFKQFSGHLNWKVYENLKLIERDLSNIIGLIDWCNANQEYFLLVELALTITRYLYNRGLWRERTKIGKMALHAAEGIGDRMSSTLFLLEDIGWSSAKLGDTYFAKDCFEQVLSIIDSGALINGLDYFWIRSRIALNLAAIEGRAGSIEIALKYLSDGIKYSEEISIVNDKKRMQNQLYGELGIIYNKTGNLIDAEKYLVLALGLAKDINDSVRYCKIAFTLAELQVIAKKYEEATITLDETAILAEETGRPQYVAEVKLRKAKLLEAKANEMAWDAYRIFKNIDHPWGMKEAMEIIAPIEKPQE